MYRSFETEKNHPGRVITHKIVTGLRAAPITSAHQHNHAKYLQAKPPPNTVLD